MKKIRNFIVLMLSVILCMTGLTITSAQEVYAITQSEFDQKLNALRSEYPNYSKWTGSFNGGISCFGFANMIGNKVFGSTPSKSWTIVYSIDNVKPGDVVQYGNPNNGYGHTIFVTGVSGNTITYLDCNGNGNYSGATEVRSCGIKWDNKVSKGKAIFGMYSFSYLWKSPDFASDDTQAPVISNVQNEIGNFTSLGYIVHCNISDNVGVTKVEFHVAYGDEGQWKQYSGNIIDGNYAWAYIPISDFGYRLGTYWTHIYAYDAAGNFDRNVSLGPIYINGATLQTQNKETVKEGTYCLMNINGSWMDVNWAEDKDGAEVVIPRVFGGGGNQLFRVEYIGNGKYHLIAAFGSESRVLDINRGSSYNDPLQSGCKVDIWQQNDAEAQEFYLTPWGDGSYAIELASKDNYVIGGKIAAAGEGYYLQQAIEGSYSQHWYFCDTNGKVLNVTPEVKCTGITLNYSSMTLAQGGDTVQLTATVLPNDAANKAVSWSSSNTAAATVDANGLVTAHETGSATITASAQDGSGVTATCWINVVVVNPPSYISINTDKKIYNLSDVVNVVLNKNDESSQTIGIDRWDADVLRRVKTENTDKTYSIAASELGAGKYSVYFTLLNSVGTLDTERVEFTILCDTHSYKEEITKQPTTTENGVKTFVCTVCGTTYTETIPKLKSGWVIENQKWYYYTQGSKATGWMAINNAWYYFNGNGEMQTGWLADGTNWYYLTNSGAMAVGWAQVGQTWYYFNSSGIMQTGWLLLGNDWYYLNESGAMVVGWAQVGQNWYYFNANGTMQTGWLLLGNNWYYLNESGAMAVGWVQVGQNWYYFNANGTMQTGWLQIGNTWYYLNASGAMVTGDQWIDGGMYRFNSSGVWIG